MKRIIIFFLIFNFLTLIVKSQHWECVSNGVNPSIVNGMYSWDNRLIICGPFGTIGGSTINSVGVGWFDGINWIAELNDFSSTPPPNCFTEHASELYIGGSFKKINGNNYCNKIARLDTNSWMPLGSGVTNGEVRAMASYNGDLYVGGTFTIVDSNIVANRIAIWDGNMWNSIGTGIPGGFGVYDMEVYQNELYVSGFFSSINGISTPGIARFDGVNWNSLSTGTNGPVLTLFNDTITNRLYIGGQFTIAGGVSTPTGVAFWDGNNWFPVGLSTYLPSVALYVFNGILYNATTQYGITNNLGDTIRNLAWFDGTNWLDVGGGLDAEANVMTVYNDELYIGGHFSYAGDSLVNGIAKWIPGSLGFNENNLDKLNLKITPNPAADEVEIEFALKNNSDLQLQIHDIKGKLVLEEKISGIGSISHKINTFNFAPGVYNFSILNEKIMLSVEKVVIQK